MKVEYINPFLTSAVAAFKTMLACDLVRGNPYVKNGSLPEHEVSGIIGLSGRAQGTVVLSLSRETAMGGAQTERLRIKMNTKIHRRLKINMGKAPFGHDLDREPTGRVWRTGSIIR